MDELISNIMQSPENTNPNVLKGQLEKITGVSMEDIDKAIEKYFEENPLPDSLPNVSSSDKGKLLTVNLNGEWVAKNSGFATPEDFGAKGDGTTDDSDALQAAVDSGNLIAPSGKIYLITKPVLFKNHIYEFSGSTIKMADNYAENKITIDSVTRSYIGIGFDNVDGFCVKNLIIDGNKAGNETAKTVGAMLSSSKGVFINCSFINATYKNLNIYNNCKLNFYSTTFKNIGTIQNSSDVYVSNSGGQGTEAEVMFNGVYATRENDNQSTAQVFYIASGRVMIQNVFCDNCYTLSDSRSGVTIVRNAIVNKAKTMNFIDDESTRTSPADITFENVRFYDLIRNNDKQPFVMQIAGVKALTLKNVYVDVNADSSYNTAVAMAANYGKLVQNVCITNLRIDCVGGTPAYGFYFSGDNTMNNIYLEDCVLSIPTETANAYAFRIDNVPQNVVVKDCVFENFGKKQVFAGKENLIKISNATLRQAATTDLPTLSPLDTGSIIYDKTEAKFKIWNGTAWILLN